MKKALIGLCSFALVCALAAPAMAADAAEWSFYGDARVSTMVYDTDEVNSPNGPLWDDTDTMWHFQDSSRIGARVAAGDITGHFELRFDEGTDLAAGYRHLFAEWNFGMGYLGVGYTYTPMNMFYSGQAGYNGNGMVTTGIYTGSDGMLRLRFPGIGDFLDINFALVEPANLQPDGLGEDAAIIVGTDADNTLPQLEVSLVGRAGPVRLELDGAWVELEDTRIVGNAEREYDIDAWAVSFGVMFNMGPFYANGLIHTGENVVQLGMATWPGTGTARYDAVNDVIVDSDRWGYNLVLGFKVNDMFSIEAGYGYDEVDSNVVGNVDDETSEWYVQFPFSPAKGVTFIPEIGELDNETTLAGADAGDEMYYGVYWKISF
jgi:hypothetical protein